MMTNFSLWSLNLSTLSTRWAALYSNVNSLSCRNVFWVVQLVILSSFTGRKCKLLLADAFPDKLIIARLDFLPFSNVFFHSRPLYRSKKILCNDDSFIIPSSSIIYFVHSINEILKEDKLLTPLTARGARAEALSIFFGQWSFSNW